MKKYLLPHDRNWYRANLHCHSTCSDGHLTPEQLKEAYKGHGYSVLAITDHEILLDHSDLNDEEFLTITSSEYSISQWPPHYPAIDGIAPDISWNRMKTIHMNIFSKDPHNTFQTACAPSSLNQYRERYEKALQCDGYERKYTVEGINETIRMLNEAGFLVQYNHPNWSLNEREDYIRLEGLWALEILNYATELETGAEYCPYIYDDMTRNGMYHLYCTMGDDNHNNDLTLRQSFGGSTMIAAKELKYEQIMEALEKGEFYCTSGKDNPPLIHALYVEDNVIKIDCSPATSVFCNGYCRADRNVNGVDITHAEFPLRESDVFFRITVRDKYGNNAHTHNYFVRDYLEK